MKKFFKENIVLIVLIALLVGMFIMKNQILSIYNDRHQKVKEIEVLDKNTLKEKTNIRENKDVLIINERENENISILTQMIQEKITCTFYQLNTNETIHIENYDLILIEIDATNEQNINVMKNYLSTIDFKRCDISFYWIGAFNNQQFEGDITKNIHNGNILNGFGVNGDEISEKEDVSYLMDGWLTSVSYHEE